MPVCRVRVILSLLVNIVNRRGQITLKDASNLFDLEENSLKEFIKILMNKGILAIEYSAEGDTILRKGESVQSIIHQKELNERVNAVLDEVNIEEMEEAHKAESILVSKKKKTEENQGT